jgi:ATP-dependent helicase YprA (DUF1998 family)
MINLFNIFKPKPDTEIKSVVFDRLYPYQKDAVQTTMLNSKGIVCMPTSTGKTFCQAAIIADDVIKNRKQLKYMLSMLPASCFHINFLKKSTVF